MHLNFLCQHHRRVLNNDPSKAGEFWLDCHARLTAWQGAPSPHRVNLAGSALEAAGIYLLAQPAPAALELERYTDSALQLIDMLGQLGETGLAITVVAGASAMLEHLALHGAEAHAALVMTRRLTLQGLGTLDGVTREGGQTARTRRDPAKGFVSELVGEPGSRRRNAKLGDGGAPAYGGTGQVVSLH